MQINRMRSNPAWIALASLALASLACSLFFPGTAIPESDTPPAGAPEAGESSGDLQTAFEELPVGDAASGEEIFNQQACHTCHTDLPVGPPFPGELPLADLAANRRPGYSAGLYLYESIVEPDAFIVEGFHRGIMPGNFGKQLSQQGLADLIAYLVTVK